MRTSGILFLFILLATNLLIAAPGLGQGRVNKTISLDYQNSSLLTVLKAIERKADLVIMYELTPRLENEKVTISVKDKRVADILDMLTAGRDLKWSIKEPENIIRLEQAPKPAMSPLPVVVAAPRITGIVRDASGKPLAGASITVTGGKGSATTDAGGMFGVEAREGDVIVISFVSHETLAVRVTAEIARKGTIGSIVLIQSISDLDETVIIAYGTTTRRMATGNVSTISADDIRRQPVTNVLQALEGRVPGLFVTQSNGLPGGQMNASIRGQLSVASGKLPLYIIDGVPFTETPIKTIGGSTYDNAGAAGYIDPMNSVNPADIESISILKDADATSIYGSRGANGVVLITTKRGKAGNTRFDVNASTGAGKVARMMPVLNLQQYLAMRRQAFANDNVTPNNSNAPDLTLWDTTKSTDFQKYFIGGTAHQTDLTGSFSGGDQRIRYLFSGTYHRETTVFPGSSAYNRFSTHLNVENTSLNGRFTIGVSAFYTKEKNNLPTADVTRIWNLPPDYPLYTTGGLLNWTGGIINPLSYFLQQFTMKSDNILANTFLRYTILPGLSAKVSVGYNKLSQTTEVLYPRAATNPANAATSSGTFSNNYVESYIIEPQLDYLKNIGPGKLTVTAGGTMQSTTYGQPYFVSVSGFSNDQLMTSWAAAATINTKTSSFTDYKYASLFARAGYTLKDRYLLNLTARRDGSSRFGPSKQWGNFGSVGAAWIFSNEDWFKKSVPVVSYGKLRGSYGTVGNDQIRDYGYLATYSTFVYTYDASGIYPTRVANPLYGWESSRKMEAGLEIGILKDRIMLSSSWFSSRTGNQLVSAPLSSQSGFSTYQANLPAIVESHGWEAELKTVNVKKRSFSWSSSFNITVPRNKLVSFPGLAGTIYSGIYVEGKSINTFNGYHYLGVINGVPTVEDVNKDGKITSGLSENNKGDYRILYIASPYYYGGLSNTVQYKSLRLDVLFQFVKQMKSNNRSVQPGAMSNQDTRILDEGFKPSMTAGSPASMGFTSYYYYSDAAISDASFIRLKNVSIT
ncbi:MAG: SusC/RagA family TonB-linked outer membrane protein, partial [Bacteroidetes bacterium]|nr:SusC/RagA family TonB-linked outer membrane protein [Bacteroidota bacterium]